MSHNKDFDYYYAPITQPSLGDSEEVVPTYVQPKEINPSTKNVQPPQVENYILRSNARQRTLPPVPSFIISKMGQNLAH